MAYHEKQENDYNYQNNRRYQHTQLSAPEEATHINPNRIYIRLVIPSRMAGPIIGRGGSQVKKLRYEYDATILIPDSNSHERIINIIANLPNYNDPTQDYTSTLRRCCTIIHKIGEHLQEAEVRFAGGDLSKLRQNLNLTEGPIVDMRILINETLINFLKTSDEDDLSKNKIEMAKNYSGIHEIKLFDMVCPRSTDYIIKMVGQPENIGNCVYYLIDKSFQILQRMATNGIHEKMYHPSPGDYDLADLYGGFNDLNNQTADLRKIGKAALNSKHGPMVYAYQDGIDDKSGFNDLKESIVFRRGPPPAPPHFDGNVNLNTPKSAPLAFIDPVKHNEHKCSLSIPNSVAYNLIGVDGSRLKEIAKDADIPISLEPPFDDKRIVHIGPGTQSQIYDAQYLLRRCIEDPEFAILYDTPTTFVDSNIVANLLASSINEADVIKAMAAAGNLLQNKNQIKAEVFGQADQSYTITNTNLSDNNQMSSTARAISTSQFEDLEYLQNLTKQTPTKSKFASKKGFQILDNGSSSDSESHGFKMLPKD